MALAENSGSPHFAANAADRSVVADPCHTRGAPAYGRGSVVAESSAGRIVPVQLTPSSRHSRRSSSYFSSSRSQASSWVMPNSGSWRSSLPLPITGSRRPRDSWSTVA